MSILDKHDERHEYAGKVLRMKIAYQVRLIRLQRDWTQSELAKRCNTHKSVISNVENWDREFPSVTTLKIIAVAFDCTLKISFEGWEGLIEELVPYFHEELEQTHTK